MALLHGLGCGGTGGGCCCVGESAREIARSRRGAACAAMPADGRASAALQEEALLYAAEPICGGSVGCAPS